MKRRQCLSILVGLSLAALTGQAVAADAPAERARAIAATYSASFEQVWAAVSSALEALGLPVSADDKAEGYVLCETGASAQSWRERIAIFVESAAGDFTRVAVVYKRSPGSHITALDSIPRLIADLDRQLKRI